jgi:FkbM family methyltransferase
MFPKQCVVIAFEARESADDLETQRAYELNGVRTILVNACIADRTGTGRLFINKQVASSSMLPPSPQAVNEHIAPFAPPEITTWGENTELDREIALNTISLGDFLNDRGVTPDVLSIDAQGMELLIMKGMGRAIDLTNAVISEVEFFEIYSGQGLFHEQFGFLAEHGFRLADLLNSQFWHPGPVCGQGFYTVAEALWFKKIDAFLSYNEASDHLLLQGIKLAAVGFAFERFSYAYMLLKRLMARDEAQVVELCQALGFEVLLKLVEAVDKNLPYYALDTQFFKNLKFLCHPNSPPVYPKADPNYFNEAFYLQQYPDVARAVEIGMFRSGWAHFVQYGQFENRLPVPYFEYMLDQLRHSLT